MAGQASLQVVKSVIQFRLESRTQTLTVPVPCHAQGAWYSLWVEDPFTHHCISTIKRHSNKWLCHLDIVQTVCHVQKHYLLKPATMHYIVYVKSTYSFSLWSVSASVNALFREFILSVVSSQHIWLVVSYKQLWKAHDIPSVICT